MQGPTILVVELCLQPLGTLDGQCLVVDDEAVDVLDPILYRQRERGQAREGKDGGESDGGTTGALLHEDGLPAVPRPYWGPYLSAR